MSEETTLSSSQERRGARVVGILLGPVLFVLLAGVIAHMTQREWSGARIAPSAAFLDGLTVYAPEEEGAVLSSLYGPMSVAYYLPACLLGGAMASLIAAGMMNVAALLVPLVALIVLTSRHRQLEAWGTALLATATALAWPPTQQMLGGIHVDAPAVGLGLLACLFLSGSAAPRRRNLALAASCTVLAAWTKQVEAPLAFAQLLYLVLRFGRRPAIHYFFALAIAALAVSAFWLVFFPLDALLFNLVQIPGTQRFTDLDYLPKEMARFLPPFLLVCWFSWRATRDQRKRWIEAPGALLFLAFLFLLPLSMLARAKVGGFLNSFHALAFLLAATAVTWSAWAESSATTRRRVPLLSALLGLVVLPWGLLPKYTDAFSHVGHNPHARAASFASLHPGEAYFPWHPLAHLEGEGKLYHFDYAVRDRELAGFAMSDEHIRAHLPGDLRWILVDGHAGPPSILQRLPAFSVETTLEEMPGWRVFVRPEDER